MEISGLPIPEVFAFSFNTLLCDMLMLSSEYREQILEAQKNLLEKCVNALEINDHEGDVEKSGTYYWGSFKIRDRHDERIKKNFVKPN